MEAERTLQFHRIFYPIFILHLVVLVDQLFQLCSSPDTYIYMRLVGPSLDMTLMIVWWVVRQRQQLRENPKSIYINFIYLLQVCIVTTINCGLRDKLPYRFQEVDIYGLQFKFAIHVLIGHACNFNSLVFTFCI